MNSLFMFVSWKSYKNGWFRATPMLGNPHVWWLILLQFDAIVKNMYCYCHLLWFLHIQKCNSELLYTIIVDRNRSVKTKFHSSFFSHILFVFQRFPAPKDAPRRYAPSPRNRATSCYVVAPRNWHGSVVLLPFQGHHIVQGLPNTCSGTSDAGSPCDRRCWFISHVERLGLFGFMDSMVYIYIYTYI